MVFVSAFAGRISAKVTAGLFLGLLAWPRVRTCLGAWVRGLRTELMAICIAILCKRARLRQRLLVVRIMVSPLPQFREGPDVVTFKNLGGPSSLLGVEQDSLVLVAVSSQCAM